MDSAAMIDFLTKTALPYLTTNAPAFGLLLFLIWFRWEWRWSETRRAEKCDQCQSKVAAIQGTLDTMKIVHVENHPSDLKRIFADASHGVK